MRKRTRTWGYVGTGLVTVRVIRRIRVLPEPAEAMRIVEVVPLVCPAVHHAQA
jgi:hypothetical protein